MALANKTSEIDLYASNNIICGSVLANLPLNMQLEIETLKAHSDKLTVHWYALEHSYFTRVLRTASEPVFTLSWGQLRLALSMYSVQKSDKKLLR
jgi:hypothetical protein